MIEFLIGLSVGFGAALLKHKALPDYIKLVKFSNGKYAVRKGFWFTGYSYLDLKSERILWWNKGSGYFKDCLGDKDYVFNEYNKGCPNEDGEPVISE